MKNRKNLIFCFAGPAASGKSTICRKVVERDDAVCLSISTTTRDPRSGEVDGVDYFFVSKEEFKKRITAGEFLEYAEFNGNLYGTEKKNIELAANKNADLLLDIEVQGVEQVKKIYGSNVSCIFVFPPSFAELEKRLRSRGTDNEKIIQSRLVLAKKEVEILKSKGFSDYFIINDVLEESVSNALSIIAAQRLKYENVSFVIKS